MFYGKVLIGSVTGDTSLEVVFNYDTATNKTFSIVDLNDAPLSTQEFENDMQISVYPNPTTDYLNIETELEINTIEMYSLQGQKIASYKNQNSINVSHLSEGIYFLKLTDSFNRTETIKFIKR
ncbi:MAG: T9SS type A sorting domain-containing protein [Flavobacteriaceae bacterium]|nr:MAG: T9SS type A sorting domain-containing protein [Flavobacteriaceae bacterium]